MSGYRIKQTIFMAIGLVVGIWLGNYLWHVAARSQAQEIAERFVFEKSGEKPSTTDPGFRQAVDWGYEEIVKKWSEPTSDNLANNVVIYGFACAVCVGIGFCLAALTGGKDDKTREDA